MQAALPRDRTAALLAAAFQDDPVMAFICPDPEARRSRLPLLFGLLYDSDVPRGACLASPGGEAVTVWRAPGNPHASLWETVRHGPALAHALGSGLGRALAYSVASDANHPAEPHWYLHLAGCDPAQQGRGHGGAAVRAGLGLAERDGVPAYLETATEENIGFYQSFGFRVTHTWQVRGRLTNWSMYRPAGRVATVR